MAIRETNPFDAPVAGQSLTDTPKNYPWENPARFPSLEKASIHIWRELNKKDALKGRMPIYKFIGNIILTKTQNLILKTNLRVVFN